MRYANFRAIGRIMGILAWVLGLLTFILCLLIGVYLGAAAETGGTSYLVIGILGGILWGFLIFIFLYALSQFIYVSIDIERNTRQTLRALLEEVESEEGETEEST